MTSQVAGLKAKFDQKDYKGVLAAAPALLTQAQGLAAAAGAAKQAAEAAALEAMNGEWGTLSADIPAQLAAVTSRVDILSKSKKLPAGLDAASLTRRGPAPTKPRRCGARPPLPRRRATWSRPSGPRAR